jgi:hypothetical protein
LGPLWGLRWLSTSGGLTLSATENAGPVRDYHSRPVAAEHPFGRFAEVGDQIWTSRCWPRHPSRDRVVGSGGGIGMKTRTAARSDRSRKRIRTVVPERRTRSVWAGPHTPVPPRLRSPRSHCRDGGETGCRERARTWAPSWLPGGLLGAQVRHYPFSRFQRQYLEVLVHQSGPLALNTVSYCTVNRTVNDCHGG